jgi:hypothetical protein
MLAGAFVDQCRKWVELLVFLTTTEWEELLTLNILSGRLQMLPNDESDDDHYTHCISGKRPSLK